ncbi:hypothetical protein DWV22_09605 [Weissella confusa]|uniref:hypothetical protein n=1 Tax=Weissella confusa TaxID=1583 RepID=UPI000E4E54F1|nr:hypothetical protein [Weissella confusa]RGX44602.1 hypothetical protein DWV22_09605 [Weissella confusa]
MIKQNDVIRARFPYPDMISPLARHAHMYIVKDNQYDFFKVQSFKPTHVQAGYIDNMLIEEANINRNPFDHTSVVDLDKIFSIRDVELSETMLTEIRRDISRQFADEINDQLHTNVTTFPFRADDFVSINPDASRKN